MAITINGTIVVDQPTNFIIRNQTEKLSFASDADTVLWEILKSPISNNTDFDVMWVGTSTKLSTTATEELILKLSGSYKIKIQETIDGIVRQYLLVVQCNSLKEVISTPFPGETIEGNTLDGWARKVENSIQTLAQNSGVFSAVGISTETYVVGDLVVIENIDDVDISGFLYNFKKLLTTTLPNSNVGIVINKLEDSGTIVLTDSPVYNVLFLGSAKVSSQIPPFTNTTSNIYFSPISKTLEDEASDTNFYIGKYIYLTATEIVLMIERPMLMDYNNPNYIDFQSEGTTISRRPIVNFISSPTVTVSVVDNPTEGRVDVSIGGTGDVGDRMLIVDDTRVPLAGKVFPTWGDPDPLLGADAYLATLGGSAPSASNPWNIIINGENTEDIIVKPYVNILGNYGSTILSGTITTTVLDRNTSVSNCIIKNLHLHNPNHYFNFKNCEIDLGILADLTHGVIYMGNCDIKSGLFNSMTDGDLKLKIYSSIVRGGTFNQIARFDNVLFSRDGAWSLEGGYFNNCSIKDNNNGLVLDGGYIFNIQNTTYEETVEWFIESATIINCSNVVFPKGMSIEFNDASSVLTTINCSCLENGVLTIVSAGAGQWINKGSVYDNRISGLTAEEVQGAIDELKTSLDSLPPASLGMFKMGLGIGTVATNGTTALVGTLTNFDQDFHSGDFILVDGETVRTIDTVTDATHLTVGVAFSGTDSLLTYTVPVIMQNEESNQATDSFLLGAPTIDVVSGYVDTDYYKKLFFHKPTGAFRVGRIVSEEWNIDNLGENSFACGAGTTATGESSHAEGDTTDARGVSSHAEGSSTIAIGDNSHAEGNRCFAVGENSHAEGEQRLAQGICSHAEGLGSETTGAIGDYSHAEGYQTLSLGSSSHAEGLGTIASGDYSHAEGRESEASGDGSHAEAGGIASGTGSHAEGYESESSGNYSHAEGYRTESSGYASHAMGKDSIAYGYGSYAHSAGKLVASGDAQYMRYIVSCNEDYINPSNSQKFVEMTIGNLGESGRIEIPINSIAYFRIECSGTFKTTIDAQLRAIPVCGVLEGMAYRNSGNVYIPESTTGGIINGEYTQLFNTIFIEDASCFGIYAGKIDGATLSPYGEQAGTYLPIWFGFLVPVQGVLDLLTLQAVATVHVTIIGNSTATDVSGETIQWVLTPPA